MRAGPAVRTSVKRLPPPSIFVWLALRSHDCIIRLKTKIHRRDLTVTVHTPALKLAFKSHPVEAGEDADALKLPLDELALVPTERDGNHGNVSDSPHKDGVMA